MEEKEEEQNQREGQETTEEIKKKRGRWRKREMDRGNKKEKCEWIQENGFRNMKRKRRTAMRETTKEEKR